VRGARAQYAIASVPVRLQVSGAVSLRAGQTVRHLSRPLANWGRIEG
jgi:hypothetical protein